MAQVYPTRCYSFCCPYPWPDMGIIFKYLHSRVWLGWYLVKFNPLYKHRLTVTFFFEIHALTCTHAGARYEISWWCHQMKTFSALLALCERNPPVTGGFPSPRPVTRNFDVFFGLRLNKRLSKQSRQRRFETPSLSLWHHCNVLSEFNVCLTVSC